jgi:enolase
MPSHITGLIASQRLDASGNPALKVKLIYAEGNTPSLLYSNSYANSRIGTSTSLVPVANADHVPQVIRNMSQIIAPALPNQFLDVKSDLMKIDSYVSELKGEKGEALRKEERLGVSIACARAGADALVRFSTRFCFLVTFLPYRSENRQKGMKIREIN